MGSTRIAVFASSLETRVNSMTLAISSSSTLVPPMSKNGTKQLGFFSLRCFEKVGRTIGGSDISGCGDLKCGVRFVHHLLLNFRLGNSQCLIYYVFFSICTLFFHKRPSSRHLGRIAIRSQHVLVIRRTQVAI